MQSLGYRQLSAFVDGEITLPEAVEQTKRATTAYARRQRTWFRSEPAQLKVREAPDLDTVVSAFSDHRRPADGRMDDAGAR